MSKLIPTTSLLGIIAIFSSSIYLGLRPLTYQYPEGTHLRELLLVTVLMILLITGFTKGLQHIVKAIKNKSIIPLAASLLYITAGFSGIASFSISYKAMGYTMAD